MRFMKIVKLEPSIAYPGFIAMEVEDTQPPNKISLVKTDVVLQKEITDSLICPANTLLFTPLEGDIIGILDNVVYHHHCYKIESKLTH